MCRHADTANAPSVFAVSLLFGGGSGALIAAAAGLNGGMGFLLGASFAFFLLWASVLRPRQVAASEHEPLLREAEGDRSPRAANPAGSTPS
jgi:hypothetical protein